MTTAHSICVKVTLFAIFLAFMPSNADADSARDRAKVLFKEGVNLFGKGDYEKASDKFLKANEAFPSWKLLYNIAQCQVLQKYYGLALENFEAYLIEGGDSVPQGRQEEVRKEIARLRDMCGDLNVSAPAGSLILIDNIQRAKTPTAGAIPVGAGMHSLTVVLGEDMLLKRDIRVHGKKEITVEVEARDDTAAAVPAAPPETEPEGPPQVVEESPVEDTEPEETPVLPPDPADEDAPNKKLVAGSVLAAVGGATLIAGVITGGVSRSKTKELENNCPDKQCPGEGNRDLYDQAVSLSVATNVLIPTGLVLATTGTLLILFGSREEKEESEGAEVNVTAAVDRGQLGLIMEGRF